MKAIGDTLPRRFKATANGAITAGKPLIVQADGAVAAVATDSASEVIGSEVVFNSGYSDYVAGVHDENANKVVIVYKNVDNYGVAIVGTVDAGNNSISFGTAVVFQSADSYNFSCAYDSTAQKVVIAFGDPSFHGYAIVGTVSGTSISFGSSTEFLNSYCSYLSANYDTNAGKIVISYRDDNNSGYGTAIVGTVSGTSISFGSAVVFESASSSYLSSAYDAAAQKHVIAYRDGGNSNYGTAIVGTVSGTSISFGTAAVFESASTLDCAVSYDDNAEKTVIAYKDGGNSNYGTAIVATVSGTSISYGTAVVFESATSQEIKSAFDKNAQRVVIIYEDAGNSNYGTVVVGTVSNTSISFGSASVYDTAEPRRAGTFYDSTNKKVIIAYGDKGNSNYGTARVFQAAYSNVNLTSENYIGIAEYAAADTETATVIIKGGVSTTQSSLTPGQTYFVQTDGTIGTSADSPSVTAGTAVTSTKLIVKG